MHPLEQPPYKWSGLVAALWHAPAAIALVLAGAATPALSQSAVVATEVKVPTVTVSQVRMAEVIGQVAVSGTLVARNEVLIYPQISGFSIDSLEVQVGDAVSAGDVLATLATQSLKVQVTQAQAEIARVEAGVRQAQSQIDTAQAGLTQAEAQLSRVQQLLDRQAGTQASLDQAIAAADTARAAFSSATDGLAVAQAQRENAQAQLDLAMLNLDHAQITTPVDGIVSDRNGQIGAIAASGGDPIYRIIAEGAVDVELEVIESSLGAISVGNPVTLDIASNGAVIGKVVRISPTVDRVNRLATVTVEVPADPALRPGLFASGTIEIARHDSLTVPTTAILTEGGVTYVLRVQDGVVDRQVVTAGLIWQDYREIIKGLTSADVVIARAGAFFTEGDVVNTMTDGIAVATDATTADGAGQ